MKYLLDSNIFIAYCRQRATAEVLDRVYNLDSTQNKLYYSTVTLGELDSFIKRNDLGKRKQLLINQLLQESYQIDINITEIINKYGDIENFSQTKLKLPGHDFTARNMGKNDLWIAATASHFGLTLLTTDRDFDHLDGAYLELAYIDPTQ